MLTSLRKFFHYGDIVNSVMDF